MQQKPFISIVSPVFNGELLIHLLIERLSVVLNPIAKDYEIILIDDGSTDNSVAILKSIALENARIKVVILANNHGQHIAIKAGLDFCRGEWIVVMDCDLQDEPEAITHLLEAANFDYDAVFAARKKQYDVWYKQWYSAFFYKTMAIITGKKFSGSTANFGMYSKQLINKVSEEHYYHFFFPLAVRKYVKKYTTIAVTHAPRAAGTTGYSFIKALGLAIKIIKGNTWNKLFNKKHAVVYAVKETINLS